MNPDPSSPKSLDGAFEELLADLRTIESLYSMDGVAHYTANQIERIFDKWLYESRSPDGDGLVSVDTTGLLPGHATTGQRRAGEASTGESLTVDASGTLRSEACFDDGAASTAEGSKLAGSEPADSHHHLKARLAQLEQENTKLREQIDGWLECASFQCPYERRMQTAESRVAQLAQEQATLHDLISEIHAHVDFEAGDMPELQVRIDAVLTDGDHASCRRWQELEAAEAALGEIRHALQQLQEKYDELDKAARGDAPGESDALVPQPPVGETSTDR